MKKQRYAIENLYFLKINELILFFPDSEVCGYNDTSFYEREYYTVAYSLGNGKYRDVFDRKKYLDNEASGIVSVRDIQEKIPVLEYIGFNDDITKDQARTVLESYVLDRNSQEKPIQKQLIKERKDYYE